MHGAQCVAYGPPDEHDQHRESGYQRRGDRQPGERQRGRPQGPLAEPRRRTDCFPPPGTAGSADREREEQHSEGDPGVHAQCGALREREGEPHGAEQRAFAHAPHRLQLQRGWTELETDPAGQPWPAPVTVSGTGTLTPVQEIPVSKIADGTLATNDAAQRALAIIELFAIAPAQAPS
jgi:hypothetical protein